MITCAVGCGQAPDYGKECSEIKELRIVNRTGNERIVDTTMVSDVSSIREFCGIISKKVNVGNPNVQSNFGFYQMDIIFKSGRESSVHVIYSVYQGIVLRETGDIYSKQDEILDYVLRNVKYK